MKILSFVLSAVLFLIGFTLYVDARSIMDQLGALLVFIWSAIFLMGAFIIGKLDDIIKSVKTHKEKLDN